MSKVSNLLAVASKIESKYAGRNRLYGEGTEKQIVEDHLYIAANQALRSSNMLEQTGEDPESIKKFDSMHSGLIEEALDNLTQALVKYRNLKSKLGL